MWNTSSASWIGNSKTETVYDQKGNILQYEQYTQWNSTRNDWVGSYKQVRKLNAQGKISRDTTFVWNNNIFDWTVKQSIAYYYSNEDPSGFSDNTFTGIRIYPIPAKDYLLIDGLTEKVHLEICDLAGKIIMQGEVVNGEKIQLNDFTGGVYLLKIDGNAGRLTRKIVVQ
jgi:hypothetical protein